MSLSWPARAAGAEAWAPGHELDHELSHELGLELAQRGVAQIPALLSVAECAHLRAQLCRGEGASGGTRRLLAQPWCAELAQRLLAHPRLQSCLPADAVAVQASYFEKSLARNWLVPVHQDLSIPVAQPSDAPGYQGWSRKEGAWFVQPPAEVLARLVALRLHLDACGPEDGPLLVLPGTHRQGVVPADQAAALRHAGPVQLCTADEGAAWLMKPLLLHASSKATGHSQRRVLHLVFGPPTLPQGVRWDLALSRAGAAAQALAPGGPEAG